MPSYDIIEENIGGAAMDILKLLFPFSFRYKKDITQLFLNILTYLAAGLVAAILISLTAKVAVLGMIVGLIGGLVDLYILAGIVVCVLDYLKILR